MKKLIVMCLIMAFLLVACGPDYKECDYNWASWMDKTTLDPGVTINIILNNTWPPDSVGAFIQECVEDGWTGFRD